MSTLYTLTADTVRLFRMTRRWTQARAARWYGVSVRQWRRYEKGDTVSVPLLKRIAKAAPKQ